MLIVFAVDIVCEEGDHLQLRKTLWKKFDYTLNKPIGKSFKDGAWQGLNEVTTFNIKLKDGLIEASFADIVLATQELCEKEELQFRRHGWKQPEEWVPGEILAWDMT